MNFRPSGYVVVCALAIVYLVAANARGYIPFAGSITRSSGGAGSGGRVFIFHK
ncbi:MAG TPA: hypothetical protein VHZ99_03160 [Steroidobacteraceae bacterium]|jgi:hypothetical protein|nr:hypothetical protein [Steroidobacteraceae bacterium]